MASLDDEPGYQISASSLSLPCTTHLADETLSYTYAYGAIDSIILQLSQPHNDIDCNLTLAKSSSPHTSSWYIEAPKFKMLILAIPPQPCHYTALHISASF